VRLFLRRLQLALELWRSPWYSGPITLRHAYEIASAMYPSETP
jgi:hypothetical protein